MDFIYLKSVQLNICIMIYYLVNYPKANGRISINNKSDVLSDNNVRALMVRKEMI